jgi:hypothetical protein
MFTYLIRPTSCSKGYAAMNAADVIAAFAAAMPQRGLVPLDHLITDGRIDRCARIVRREVPP